MFYYNSRTKETTWSKPAAMMQPAAAAAPLGIGGLAEGWTENVDPGSGKAFYFNKTTNESRWERPAAALPAALPAAVMGGAVDITGLKQDIEAALKPYHDAMVAQCVQLCEARLKGGGAALPPGWAEHDDPGSGKKFYYNASTQETRWERPAPIPKPASPALPTAAGLPRALGSPLGSPGVPPSPVLPKPAMLGGLPPGWTENQDPGTGKTFYYNATTQESKWDRPAAAPMVAPPIAPKPAMPPPGPTIGGLGWRR